MRQSCLPLCGRWLPEGLTEGVLSLKKDTPPVTACTVPAPSERGPRELCNDGKCVKYLN